MSRRPSSRVPDAMKFPTRAHLTFLVAVATNALLLGCGASVGGGGATGGRGGGGGGIVGQGGQTGATGGSPGSGGSPGNGGAPGSGGSPGGGGSSNQGGTSGSLGGSGGSKDSGGTGGLPSADALGDGANPSPPDLAPPPVAMTDCTQIPTGPFTTKRVAGIEPEEDVTFDDAGNLYWSKKSGGIFKNTADGKSTQLVPRVLVPGGMRMSPSGDLYAVIDANLEVIAPNGTRSKAISGLDLNCLEVDPKGRAYVGNFGATEVLRYDPLTKNIATLTKGIIDTPNGLTFNRMFDVLYVNTWGADPKQTIFQIPVKPDGTMAGAATPFVKGIGGGTFDGMGVDECGNIYVADSGGVGDIIRFSPDGKRHDVIISRPNETLHNLVWGRGKGWSETKLYIVSLEEGLFETELGVRSKKYW